MVEGLPEKKVKYSIKLLQATLYTLFVSTFFSSAFAGSFADSFRDYILAEERQMQKMVNVSVYKTGRSQKCMQCHDGSNAKATKISSNSSAGLGRHANSNHPMGLSYANTVARQPHSYVPVGQLDTRIRLENGAVTCVSCHETKPENSVNHRQDHSQPQTAALELGQTESCSSTGSLTVGTNQTGLCMSCHAM